MSPGEYPYYPRNRVAVTAVATHARHLYSGWSVEPTSNCRTLTLGYERGGVVPSLPFPYRSQENHTLDEFRIPAWSSGAGAVAHCVHEYKSPANVKRGERSQEITFDFVSAEAGIYRSARTVPGHRYRIEAWGKHVRSQSPVELSLGVDLTGGEDWQAASVTWQEHWF